MVVPHIEFETDHVTDALCRPATIGKTFWVWTLLEKLNDFCDLGIIEPSWASGREGRFKRPSFAEANSPNAHSTGFDAKMLSNGSGRPLGIIQEGLRRETTFFELLPGKPSRLPHLRHAWSLPTSLPTLHVIYKMGKDSWVTLNVYANSSHNEVALFIPDMPPTYVVADG